MAYSSLRHDDGSKTAGACVPLIIFTSSPSDSTLFFSGHTSMDQFLKPAAHNQPPSSANLIHELVGDQQNPQNAQGLAQPALGRLQMSWEADVENVYPMITTLNFLYMKEMPNPQKRVYLTSLSDPVRVVAALKSTLESWSIWRSIAVEYDQATRLLVVLRATQRYFDQAISSRADVENAHALTGLAMSPRPCGV